MPVAQTNTSRVVGTSLLLFAVALMLTAYTARHPRAARIGSVIFAEALAPFQRLNMSVHSAIGGLWERYVNLVSTKEENHHLTERLAVLEAENSRLRELQSENQRLRGLLRISEEAALPGVQADVIAYDPSNWARKITINRGTFHGVQPGMAVLEGNGIVGQVIAAGPRTAQVLLLTDPSSGVDVMVQASRGRGVVEGTGAKRCRLNYLLAGEAVKVGDRVVTSGMDGIFPKGLLIGVISFVGEHEKGKLFQNVEVKTSVNFEKLEDVLVVGQGEGGGGA